jgi:hypothetical protein
MNRVLLSKGLRINDLCYSLREEVRAWAAGADHHKPLSRERIRQMTTNAGASHWKQQEPQPEMVCLCRRLGETNS